MYRPPPTGSQQTGLVARFERPENRMVSKPVVAFDDGAAMVLSSENRLVAAYRRPGYAGLKPVPTAVGALTAEPGVRVRRWSTGDDECPAWTTWTVPVVGWLAFSDGGALPLLAVGSVEPEGCVLVHQDGTESDGGEVLDYLIPWCGQCASMARRYTADGGLCPTCHADHPAHGGTEPKKAEKAPLD